MLCCACQAVRELLTMILFNCNVQLMRPFPALCRQVLGASWVPSLSPSYWCCTRQAVEGRGWGVTTSQSNASSNAEAKLCSCFCSTLPRPSNTVPLATLVSCRLYIPAPLSMILLEAIKRKAPEVLSLAGGAGFRLASHDVCGVLSRLQIHPSHAWATVRSVAGRG